MVTLKFWSTLRKKLHIFAKKCEVDTFSFLHTFIQHISPYLFQNFLRYPCIKIEDLESRLKLKGVSQPSMKIRQIIAKNIILWLSQNPGRLLISLYSISTVPNLQVLAWKNGLRNHLNAKISNWVNMHILNELRCWFSKVSKVLPQWMCMSKMK